MFISAALVWILTRDSLTGNVNFSANLNFSNFQFLGFHFIFFHIFLVFPFALPWLIIRGTKLTKNSFLIAIVIWLILISVDSSALLCFFTKRCFQGRVPIKIVRLK